MPENTQQNHQQPKHTTTSDEMLARRRLLKLGVYVPPAVLGMMIVGGMPTPAQAVVGSCCPSACQPCIDLVAPGGEVQQCKNECAEKCADKKKKNRKKCIKKCERKCKKKCQKEWRKCNKKRARLKKNCGSAPNPC